MKPRRVPFSAQKRSYAPPDLLAAILIKPKVYSMQRDDGSWNTDDPDRPYITRDMEIVGLHPYDDGDGRYLYSKIRARNGTGKAMGTGRLLGGNDLQIAKQEWPHDFFGHPDLTNYQRGDGGLPAVLYKLTRFKAECAERPDDIVFVPEGEGDVDTLHGHGQISTTNPNGAGKWQSNFNRYFQNRDVVVLQDNDPRGIAHAQKVAEQIGRYARRVRIVGPGKGEHEDVSDYLRDHSIDDLLALVESAAEYEPGLEYEPGPSAGEAGAGATRAAPGEFSNDRNGVPNRTIRNARVALDRLGVTLRFDEFANRFPIDGLPGFGPALDDAAMTRMRLTIEERWGLKFDKTNWADIVTDEARHNSFHPVREYLDARQAEWDGKSRIDRWLITYGGAEDNEYTRKVGAIPLIAAVRRVRQPGCKFDEMLVLESEQGTNKSSALAVLAVNEQWFNDDCPLNADSKVLIEQLSGCWIAEMGELKGLRRGEVESVKSTLSRRVDKARLAYGRLSEEHPRQCVFFGTTNDSAYLRDMTGNRRFWPVRVPRFDLETLRADRDQLWAEAATREAQGESIRLPEHLWSVAGEHQAAREVIDPFLEILSERLEGLEGKVRAGDIWDALGLSEPSKRTQDHNVRLAASMQKLGWRRPNSKLRFGGPPQHAWVKGPDGVAVSAFEEVPRAVVLGLGENDGRAM